MLREGLRQIREFFWPILDDLETIKVKLIEEKDFKCEDNEYDLLLKYVERYNKSEEDRKNEVESKSVIFIGTFGVSTTILINIVRDMFNGSKSANSYSVLNLIFMAIIITTIVYLCRAIWFSIKALEKRTYHTLGFPKYLLKSNNDKKRRLIEELHNITKINQEEINIKVDYMSMAQSYFKRAIVTVFMFSGLFISKYTYECFNEFGKLKDMIRAVTFQEIFILGVILGFIIVFIVIHRLYKKIR